MDNKWELYSTLPGWEGAAAKIDEALESAKLLIDSAVTAGKTLAEAAVLAERAMWDVMNENHLRYFGATDTEPRWKMIDSIRAYIRERYGVTLDLD